MNKIRTFGTAIIIVLFTCIDIQITAQETGINNEKDTVYSFVDIMPEFPGGVIEFRKFIATVVKYPHEARTKGIEGKVYTRFMVSKTGELDSISIVKSVHPLLDNEAILAVKQSPKWIPGEKSGKKVNVWYTFPIRFNLGYESTENLTKGDNKSLQKKKFVKALKLLVDTVRKEQSDPDYKREVSSEEPNLLGNFLELRIYYDSIWQITSKSLAEFYRETSWDSTINFFEGQFTDYDIDGIKIAIGNYVNEQKNGLFKFYYTSGKIEAVGEYKNDKPFGTWEMFYENGTLMQKVLFEGENFQIVEFYNEGGEAQLINGTGSWNMWKSNWDKTKSHLKGNYLNGKRDGDWVLTQNNVQLLTENYKNGEFKKGFYYENERKQKMTQSILKSWLFTPVYLLRIENFIFMPSVLNPENSLTNNSGSAETNQKTKHELINTSNNPGYVEKMPQFPGGELGLRKFIASNVKYPQDAFRQRIEGVVYVRFCVTSTGKVDKVSIARGVATSLDEEAVRVVKTLPDWIPGEQRGKKVSVWYTVPITFGLQ